MGRMGRAGPNLFSRPLQDAYHLCLLLLKTHHLLTESEVITGKSQTDNLGHKCWKILLSAHFAPPHPCAMLM